MTRPRNSGRSEVEIVAFWPASESQDAWKTFALGVVGQVVMGRGLVIVLLPIRQNTVFHRLPWSDEISCHATLVGPRLHHATGEFAAMVHGVDWGAGRCCSTTGSAGLAL